MSDTSTAMKVPLIFTSAMVQKLPQDLWQVEAAMLQHPRGREMDPKVLLYNALVYLKLGLSTHALGEVNLAKCLIDKNDWPLLNRMYRILTDILFQMCDDQVYYPLFNVLQIAVRIAPESMSEAMSVAGAVQRIQGMLKFMEDSNDEFTKKLAAAEYILRMPLPMFENTDALLVVIALKYALFFIVRTGREKERIKKQIEGMDSNSWKNPINSRRGGFTDLNHLIGSSTGWAGIQTAMPHRYRSGPKDDRSFEAIWSACSLHRTITAIPPLAEVEIRRAPNCGGFKLVANKAISEGSFFVLEEPISHLWTDYDQKEGCAHCWMPFTLNEKYKKGPIVICSDCGEKYCSPMCLVTARDSYHGVLCGEEWKKFLVSQELPYCASALPIGICQAIKTTAMAVQKGVHPLKLPFLRHLTRRSDLSQPPSCDTERMSTLTAVSDQGSRVASIASDFVELCPKLAKKGIGHAGDVLEVLDIVMTNVTGGGERGGIHNSTVYFFFSFANHSCDSGNASYGTHAKEMGNRLYMTAKKDIQAGEEILISYIRNGMDYQTRQLILKQTYGFDCNCRLCAAEKPSS